MNNHLPHIVFLWHKNFLFMTLSKWNKNIFLGPYGVKEVTSIYPFYIPCRSTGWVSISLHTLATHSCSDLTLDQLAGSWQSLCTNTWLISLTIRKTFVWNFPNRYVGHPSLHQLVCTPHRPGNFRVLFLFNFVNEVVPEIQMGKVWQILSVYPVLL